MNNKFRRKFPKRKTIKWLTTTHSKWRIIFKKYMRAKRLLYNQSKRLIVKRNKQENKKWMKDIITENKNLNLENSDSSRLTPKTNSKRSRLKANNKMISKKSSSEIHWLICRMTMMTCTFRTIKKVSLIIRISRSTLMKRWTESYLMMTPMLFLNLWLTCKSVGNN